MKIYLYNLWIFHSSLYCTVPFCPSIYAYIIVTLRESIETLERECGLCFMWKKNVSWILFCNISDLQRVECYVCLSSLLANNNLGADYPERLVFFRMRIQLVETAKNICFGTDLHCSNVHSLISMAWSLLQTQVAHCGNPWLSTLSQISLCVCVSPCQSILSPGVMSMHSSV